MRFNKHHQTFVFCNIQYIWTDYTDIRTDYWKKDTSNFVSVIHKISIFPSTILSKSPNFPNGIDI